MKYVTIDLSEIRFTEEIHEYLKNQLDFPDYYGKNLDALFDVLTDISEDTCVQIKLIEDEEDLCYHYQRKVRHVFRDAKEMNPHLYLEL